jgi:hypothetical protein
MKVLKDIIEQWGFVTAEQCTELAEYFPRAELIIQWGASPRQPMKAINVAKRIKEVEDAGTDYVRQVFMESKSFRQLKSVLGVE